MEYTQLSLTLEEYQESKEAIKKELSGIAKSFIRTGWYLDRIDRSGAYKLDGYKTVTEFAKTEYNMTPSGVSRFIKVYNKYTIPGDTPELLPQYERFNFSQLQEMMQIPEEDHDMILPEAKKENIRELRRFNQENESDPDNLLNWKEEKQSEVDKVICEFFQTNKGLAKELFLNPAWKTRDVKELADIVNPSGNRSYRNGKVFLMMYENVIKITEFGAGKREMDWKEFFRIAEQVIEAAGNSKDEHPVREEIKRQDMEHSKAEKPENGQEKMEDAKEKPEPKEETEPKAELKTEQKTEPKQKNGQNSDFVEKPEKVKIAPAQQETEKPEKQKTIEHVGTIDHTEVMQNPQSEEADTEECEQIVTNRWEYLKKQNRYAAALELSAIAEDADYQKLRTASFWHKILGELVDENGDSVEVSMQQEEQIEGQMTIADMEQEGEKNEQETEKEA